MKAMIDFANSAHRQDFPVFYNDRSQPLCQNIDETSDWSMQNRQTNL